MASSFFELSVASTGLFTAKGALNVVSHNIANAETPGYSRQVALVKARTPLNYMNGRGMVGTGSEMYGIGQMRNFYLDTKFWANTGILGEYSTKSTQNRLIQATLNETDESGFNKMINDVFGIINRDLVPDSSSLTSRLSFIDSAQSLATYFNTTFASLQKQQSDINQEVKGVVSTINNLGVQIQNLNKQIFVSELDGSQANDLRDSRALLVDELSKYVNVSVKEVEINKDLLTGKSEKHYQVMINGYDFVDHYNLNKLSCVERTVKNNFEDVNGLYDIYWDNGVKFNSVISLSSMSGELKGLLVTRDGNNQAYPTATILGTPQEIESPPGTGTGRYTVTLDPLTANRYDWAESGSITINGVAYAYDNYSYDEVNDIMTIDIPPSKGKLTVGDSVLQFDNFTVDSASAGGTVEFEISTNMSDAELEKFLKSKKIKIGDMFLSGDITVSGGKVTITNCPKASEIASLSSSGGKTVKVGQSVDYKGIPYFISKLNTFARGIARAFNLGQDVDGKALEGVTGHYNSYNLMKYEDESNDNTGYNLFTWSGQSSAKGVDINYNLLTAGNFTVAQELLDNPRALACALSENPDISDSQAIAELLGLKHNPHVFNEGEFGNYIESIIGELGVVTNQSFTFESNYTDITSAIDYQRLSVMSVSLDEEMANMVYWQQIYNACAKMVSTLNGIYDTTINRLGL